MKRELMLWRFGAGVLGGWLMVALVLLMIVGSYVCFGLVLFNPMSHFKRFSATVEFGATISSAMFLFATFSITALRSTMRWHPIARLAPNMRIVITALTWRIAIIATIALLPACVLRAAAWVKFPSILAASASLRDITTLDYLSAALYLLHVVVLTAIAFGPFKVAQRVGFMPIYFSSFIASSRGWSWWPIAACVVFVIVFWGWQRYHGQSIFSPPPPRQDRTYQTYPQEPGTTTFFQRWEARRLKRAARASGAGSTSKRIAALLAAQSTGNPLTYITTFAATLYLAIKPGDMDAIALSWLMALPIVMLLSMPPVIPLSRIVLLPLGAERARIGEIIAAVWTRQIRTRLLICVIAGLLLHALFWSLQWPAFIRSSFFTSVSPATHLLWSPLAQAAGLYGMAVSACLLATASPRLMQWSGFLSVVPWLALIGLAPLGLAFKWVLNDVIPATAAWDMGYVTFAIVNGAMLPACAWCVHRALRYLWRKANLSAISASMHALSVRQEKALAQA